MQQEGGLELIKALAHKHLSAAGELEETFHSFHILDKH